MNTSSSGQPTEHSQPLAPGRGFLVMMALVVLLAGFIGLTVVLHIMAIFAGSFFLFFWLGVEKAAPAAFIPTLVGALGGIANGSLLHASLATALGVNPALAALVGLGVLMLAVYMLLIHKVPMLFNQAYMLFVTMAAIPLLSDTAIFVSMVECVFLSAAYFGGIFWIFRRIGARRDLNAAAEAIAPDVQILGDV